MKAAILSVICLQIITLPLLKAENDLAENDLIDAAGAPKLKPKVSILTVSASHNGTPQPDLGRALSDSLTLQLLKTGKADVIDLEAKMPKAGEAETRSGLIAAGEQAGVETIFQPTLVGEGNYYRMTVKKLAVPSGKVEAILEDTASGGSAEVFALASRLVGQFITQPNVPIFRLAPKQLPAAPREPEKPKSALSSVATQESGAEGSGAVSSLPRPSARLRPVVAHQTKPTTTAQTQARSEEEIDEIGRVCVLNPAYSFCIVRPSAGRQLKVGDQVMIHVQGFTRPTLPAKISRIEGRHAVAEFSLPEGSQITLTEGARVYKWLPVEQLNEPIPRALPAKTAPSTAY